MCIHVYYAWYFIIQLKLLITITVVRDRLLFMTKIPCMDDSGARKPARFCMYRAIYMYMYLSMYVYLVLGLCKLGTTFFDFEESVDFA